MLLEMASLWTSCERPTLPLESLPSFKSVTFPSRYRSNDEMWKMVMYFMDRFTMDKFNKFVRGMLYCL
jgi:hypothetical protein